VPLFTPKFDIQGNGYYPSKRPEQLTKQQGIISRKNVSYIDSALNILMSNPTRVSFRAVHGLIYVTVYEKANLFVKKV
jgi:hypothetical protein